MFENKHLYDLNNVHWSIIIIVSFIKFFLIISINYFCTLSKLFMIKQKVQTYRRGETGGWWKTGMITITIMYVEIIY